MDTATSAKPSTGIDTSRFRLLHTMVRVFDLEKSIDFYCRLLGMKLLRKREVEAGRYTICFVGYEDDATGTVVELTYNWDQKEPYALGAGFGHLAIGVQDIYGTCKVLEKEGVKIPRAPGPLKFGNVNIAFIDDPDGYKIELIERP
jgi:lactoylglutathione lyase